MGGMMDEGQLWTEAHGAYFTKTGLKARGWLPSMMRRFLDPPDRTVANPHDRFGEPACLYSRPRVVAVEKSPEFQAAQAARKRTPA